MKYDYWTSDYWSSDKSDHGFTSFVESEIIGMESFHKLNIPLIRLKTKSEKEDQEEKEYDYKIKNNLNSEFDSGSTTDPNSTIHLECRSDRRNGSTICRNIENRVMYNHSCSK